MMAALNRHGRTDRARRRPRPVRRDRDDRPRRLRRSVGSDQRGSERRLLPVGSLAHHRPWPTGPRARRRQATCAGRRTARAVRIDPGMSAEPPQGLREALADALVAALPERTGGPDRFYWLARADAFLAGPLAPLLAAQEAVERVHEWICRNAAALYPPIW